MVAGSCAVLNMAASLNEALHLTEVDVCSWPCDLQNHLPLCQLEFSGWYHALLANLFRVNDIFLKNTSSRLPLTLSVNESFAPCINCLLTFLISVCSLITLHNDWVKKCMEYEVEGLRPRGRPKRTWREVVREDYQARKLNTEDAVDHSKWRS